MSRKLDYSETNCFVQSFMAAVCWSFNETALEKPRSKRRTAAEHQSSTGLELHLSRVDQARVVITQPLGRTMNAVL